MSVLGSAGQAINEGVNEDNANEILAPVVSSGLGLVNPLTGLAYQAGAAVGERGDRRAEELELFQNGLDMNGEAIHGGLRCRVKPAKRRLEAAPLDSEPASGRAITRLLGRQFPTLPFRVGFARRVRRWCVGRS